MKTLLSIIFTLSMGMALAEEAKKSESKPLVLPDFSNVSSAAQAKSKTVHMQSNCTRPETDNAKTPNNAIDFERCMPSEAQMRVNHAHK